MTLGDNGNGTGTLSGTPTGADVGEVAVILKLTDAAGAMATQAFTIIVSPLQRPPAPVLTALYNNIAPTLPATIVLSADPPQNTQYLPGTIYYYYRSTNPGGERRPFPLARPWVRNSLQDQYTKTSVDQPFYFQVSTSFGGVEGPRSNEVEVTVSAAPGAPAPS